MWSIKKTITSIAIFQNDIEHNFFYYVQINLAFHIAMSLLNKFAQLKRKEKSTSNRRDQSWSTTTNYGHSMGW